MHILPLFAWLFVLFHHLSELLRHDVSLRLPYPRCISCPEHSLCTNAVSPHLWILLSCCVPERPESLLISPLTLSSNGDSPVAENTLGVIGSTLTLVSKHLPSVNKAVCWKLSFGDQERVVKRESHQKSDWVIIFLTSMGWVTGPMSFQACSKLGGFSRKF